MRREQNKRDEDKMKRDQIATHQVMTDYTGTSIALLANYFNDNFNYRNPSPRRRIAKIAPAFSL